MNLRQLAYLQGNDQRRTAGQTFSPWSTLLAVRQHVPTPEFVFTWGVAVRLGIYVTLALFCSLQHRIVSSSFPFGITMATPAHHDCLDNDENIAAEKHQTEYVDTMVVPNSTEEEPAVEHMSWHTYAGLFVSRMLVITA